MLKTGDTIPFFQLPDQSGKQRKSDEFLKKGALVLFFYPMDFTPGCTKEVCSFRDHYEDFLAKEADVVGISSDSSRSHQRFAEKYSLPFSLLSDRRNRVRKLFGIKRAGGILPARITFVVNADGKIIAVFDSLFNYHEHIEQALQSITTN